MYGSRRHNKKNTIKLMLPGDIIKKNTIKLMLPGDIIKKLQ